MAKYANVGKAARRFRELPWPLPEREEIGPPECPMMNRWTLLNTRWCKVLLHSFKPGAEDVHPHDHPRGFVTAILRGGYDDVVPCSRCNGYGRVEVPLPEGWKAIMATLRTCDVCKGSALMLGERLRGPVVRRRRAQHAHVTRVHEDGAVSVVIMGPLRQPWGFLVDGAKWGWRQYEQRYGLSFRCTDGEGR